MHPIAQTVISKWAERRRVAEAAMARRYVHSHISFIAVRRVLFLLVYFRRSSRDVCVA